MGSIGDFGGLFNLGALGLSHPVLVSSADGVGTKLHIAQLTQRFDGVGDDLVAMLVDDLVCVGAEPLFLLDIITVGKVVPARIATIVSSIAAACRRANTALLGGETAEMPGFYGPGRYDLAGFCVAVVEEDELIDGRHVQAGDQIVDGVSDQPLFRELGAGDVGQGADAAGRPFVGPRHRPAS